MSRFTKFESAKPQMTRALAAKPSTGKPDYATLRRQVMTRYRKTLAYLSK